MDGTRATKSHPVITYDPCKLRGVPGRALRVNTVVAVVVWVALLSAVGPGVFLRNMIDNWEVAFTMVFGSIVGGGTSEGGGAVAFPVFTKVLGIPPEQARLFTFATQSIGMTAASVSILVCKIPVERRILTWAMPPAVLFTVPAVYLATQVAHPLYIRVGFTALVTSLGVALIASRRRRVVSWVQVPVWEGREKVIVLATGAVGGVASAFVGVGVDVALFIVMVLLFRVSEAIATPTTVILMAGVSIAAFATHLVALDAFVPPVTNYWIAAAPIVAIGAPVGAWICSRMSAHTIRNVLIGLIGIELVSTLLIVSFTPGLAAFMAATVVTMLCLCVAAYRRERYQALPDALPAQGGAPKSLV